MLGGRAEASLHWSVLETEQERWCSPWGLEPAQAELLTGRSECREVLLAEWGAPGRWGVEVRLGEGQSSRNASRSLRKIQRKGPASAGSNQAY